MSRGVGLASALLLALGAAGCAHAPRTPVAAPRLRVAAFYPLKLGESWTYRVHSPGQVATRTVTLVGKNGGFYLDDHGGALMLDGYGLRDRDRYLIEAPLVKGHTWSSVLSVEAIEHYEIIAAGTPCEVPGQLAPGRCVVVRGSIRQNAHVVLVNEWTYAGGVGLLRLTSGVSLDRQPVTPQLDLQLVAFHPAP